MQDKSRSSFKAWQATPGRSNCHRMGCAAAQARISTGYSLTMPRVFEYVCAHFRGAEGGASAQS